MPSYDYRCPGGHEWEETHSVSDCDGDHQCTECGSLGSRLIGARPLHGAIWDKKISIGGLDQTFSTNAELREFERDNPDVKMVSQTDSWWRSHKDDAREAAERVAVKGGFRDLDQKKEMTKAAKAEGKTAAEPPG